MIPREAVGVVLDCLTSDGLLSPVSEIRFMSLSVMVEVTKNAGASIKYRAAMIDAHSQTTHCDALSHSVGGS